MDEITDRSEYSIQDSASPSNVPATFRDKMVTSLQKIVDEKSSTLLSTLMRSAEVSSDIINTIQKELVYIARIPKHLEAGVRSGALTFMQKSGTRENLGAIVGQDHMNRGFVRIEQGYLPDPNLLHSLSNLAMQQQLARMAEVLDEVRSRVIVLQETHDKSLYGKLRGMQKQLIQMKDAQNRQTRKQLATNAITVLNETRGEITQRLIDELMHLPETPDNWLGAVWKTLRTKGFNDSLRVGYDKIQELFSYYLTATQLLAYTYAFLDEPASFYDVFLPDAELSNSVSIRKLILAERCVGSIEDAWYKKPEIFLKRIQHESQELFCEKANVIEIEVTGAELLEAIIDEKEDQ